MAAISHSSSSLRGVNLSEVSSEEFETVKPQIDPGASVFSIKTSIC